jgi:hypothetical protein
MDVTDPAGMVIQRSAVDAGRGAAAQGIFNVVVAVNVLAGHRHKEVPRLDVPGVVGDAGYCGTSSLPAEGSVEAA